MSNNIDALLQLVKNSISYMFDGVARNFNEEDGYYTFVFRMVDSNCNVCDYTVEFEVETEYCEVTVEVVSTTMHSLTNDYFFKTIRNIKFLVESLMAAYNYGRDN